MTDVTSIIILLLLAAVLAAVTLYVFYLVIKAAVRDGINESRLAVIETTDRNHV